METIAAAPHAPGVHVVLHGGVVIYVGRTRRGLRDRLRRHLTGSRESSVLHDQVGQARYPRQRGVGAHVVLERGVIDYVGHTGNLRDRLRQHLTGNLEGMKEALVLALRPRFNWLVPKPR